jgi:WD40 repeat protein
MPSAAHSAPRRWPATSHRTSLAWSPDGHLLASAGQEGRLLLWDTTNPAKAPLRLIDAGPPLRRVSIRADGRQLAAAGLDGRIRLWRLPDGAALPTSADHGAPVSDLAWRQDGRQLASAGLDGRLRLWEGDGLQPAGDTALPDAGRSTVSPGQTETARW